jgi:hypothetical protein
MDSRGRVANPNYGKGVVRKTVGGAKETIADAFDGLRPQASTSNSFDYSSTNSPNSSPNGSTNQYDTPHNQGVGNNSHVNPPSNNMSNSTTKSGGGASAPHWSTEPMDPGHNKLSRGGGLKGYMLATLATLATGAVNAEAGEFVAGAMSLFDPIAHLSGTPLGSSAFGGDEMKQMNYEIYQKLSQSNNPNDIAYAHALKQNGFNYLPESFPGHSTSYNPIRIDKFNQIDDKAIEKEYEAIAMQNNIAETKEVAEQSNDKMDMQTAQMEKLEEQLEKVKKMKAKVIPKA